MQDIENSLSEIANEQMTLQNIYFFKVDYTISNEHIYVFTFLEIIKLKIDSL